MKPQIVEVSPYIRVVPKHYRKHSEIIDVTPDVNGLAEIVIERRKYVVRVKSEPKSVLGSLAENIRGRLA